MNKILNLGQRLLTDVVSKERGNQPVQGQGGEVFHYVVVFKLLLKDPRCS